MKKKSKPPVQKGHNYKLEITGIGHSGEGVGKYQDFTVFVPYALPGEQVEATVTAVKKNYAKAELAAVIAPVASRVKPLCPIYEQCGGCQLQHVDYQEQLRIKRQSVAAAVARIGKLDNVVIHPTLGALNPLYYRNKMQFPVGMIDGKAAIGCFAQGTHSIIDTEHCYIQHQVNNDIVQSMREIITDLKIPAYDEITGTGIVRHVLGRVGVNSGEVMVVVVTATAGLPHSGWIVARLRERIPGLVSVVHNVNQKKTNIILGDYFKVLWGQETIIDQLGEFKFHISAQSFFQVNTAQAEILYSKAVEYAGLTGKETVIDAYCGTGTISLFLARYAAQVYGIEIVEAAIRDARHNARTNGVENAAFIVGDAVEVMPKLLSRGVRTDVVVVDPPRAGCEHRVLETFVKMNPERIVYISCNPASLARDLNVLAKYGYITREIQPVDMFPQTYHVETVTLLQRKHTTK